MSKKIKFRLTDLVRKLYIQEYEPLNLNIGGKHDIFVTLREPTDEELNKGYKRGNHFCTAEGNYIVKLEIEQIFYALVSQKIVPPKILENSEIRKYVVDEDGNFKNEYAHQLKYYPKNFQDFCNTAKTELSEIIKKIILLIRWRYNLVGPPRPFSHNDFKWSMDGKDWHSVPHSIHMHFEQVRHIRITNGVIGEIQSLIQSDINEPLGHELFREAWEQRRQNPRSALVIGIAAAETGFKNCVSKLCPDTQWLLDEIQSPPLEKMLYKYWPTLHNVIKDDVRKLNIPRELIKSIAKGIEIRNKVVHGKYEEISYEILEEVLLAVKDILYFFDYILGSNWAMQHIREETKSLL